MPQNKRSRRDSPQKNESTKMVDAGRSTRGYSRRVDVKLPICKLNEGEFSKLKKKKKLTNQYDIPCTTVNKVDTTVVRSPFRLPKSPIKQNTPNMQDYVDYDADSEDEAFLARHNYTRSSRSPPLHRTPFEKAMGHLLVGGSRFAKQIGWLGDSDKAVHTHFKKRVAKGDILVPILQIGFSDDEGPYACFGPYDEKEEPMSRGKPPTPLPKKRLRENAPMFKNQKQYDNTENLSRKRYTRVRQHSTKTKTKNYGTPKASFKRMPLRSRENLFNTLQRSIASQ
eukprot:m.126701 g.126701  ORF g.126701 m.126701 type:complete len:282 (+) comp14522_c0_seq1:168-1013(+)